MKNVFVLFYFIKMKQLYTGLQFFSFIVSDCFEGKDEVYTCMRLAVRDVITIGWPIMMWHSRAKMCINNELHVHTCTCTLTLSNTKIILSTDGNLNNLSS